MDAKVKRVCLSMDVQILLIGIIEAAIVFVKKQLQQMDNAHGDRC